MSKPKGFRPGRARFTGVECAAMDAAFVAAMRREIAAGTETVKETPLGD